jgi:putative transposase
MARPLRLEFSGAVYHVTSRGDRREEIFLNDADRSDWLEVLGVVCARFNWVVHAFCQMTNHYHLLLETPDGNLSLGMRHLNGLYTQRFNRRHGLVGHLFQGRYKAILVQKEVYLLELTRYVVLNPLRAGMVDSLDDWHWSSYPFVVGREAPPPWLDADWLLRQFAPERGEARRAYVEFLLAGRGLPSPVLEARQQLVLGDRAFVERHCQKGIPEQLREVSKAHRRAVALPLDEYAMRYPERDLAMALAYQSGAYTMAEIGRHFAVQLHDRQPRRPQVRTATKEDRVGLDRASPSVFARTVSDRRPAEPPTGGRQPTPVSDQVYAKAQRQVDELLPLRRTCQWRLVQHLLDRRSVEALLEQHQAACRVVTPGAPDDALSAWALIERSLRPGTGFRVAGGLAVNQLTTGEMQLWQEGSVKRHALDRIVEFQRGDAVVRQVAEAEDAGRIERHVVQHGFEVGGAFAGGCVPGADRTAVGQLERREAGIAPAQRETLRGIGVVPGAEDVVPHRRLPVGEGLQGEVLGWSRGRQTTDHAW